MRVIVVDDDVNSTMHLESILTESGFVVSTFNDPHLAIAFLEKLCLLQEHIDLVTLDLNMPALDGIEVLKWIRDSQLTYSYGNFNLCSIPVIIISGFLNDRSFNQRCINIPRNTLFEKPVPLNHDKFVNQIESIILDWRKNLLEELELIGLGINYESQKFSIGYLSRPKNTNLSILSSRFVSQPQNLPYLWLNKDFFELEASLEEFETLLNLSATKSKEIQEKTFHEFFIRNPKFILRNNYGEVWSQPRLRYPNKKKFIEPDFVIKPSLFPELSSRWEVLELKLPEDGFLNNSTFHRTFTARFLKCLTQIIDYKNYFSRDDVKQMVQKKFGFHPKHPKLTILIGRFEVLKKDEEKIQDRLSDLGMADIEILTYDEILQQQKSRFTKLFRGILDV